MSERVINPKEPHYAVPDERERSEHYGVKDKSISFRHKKISPSQGLGVGRTTTNS